MHVNKNNYRCKLTHTVMEGHKYILELKIAIEPKYQTIYAYQKKQSFKNNFIV